MSDLGPVPQLRSQAPAAIVEWAQKVSRFLRDLTINEGVPSGTIAAFAGASVPAGWVPLEGQTLGRKTYASLFALFGTTWNTGGESVDQFRLPDARGRTVKGAASGSPISGGLPPSVLNAASGVDVAAGEGLFLAFKWMVRI